MEEPGPFSGAINTPGSKFTPERNPGRRWVTKLYNRNIKM